MSRRVPSSQGVSWTLVVVLYAVKRWVPIEGKCECFACDKKAPRCDHMGSDWQTLTRDAIRGAARLSERRFVCYRLDLSTRGFTGPLCCLSVRPAVILTYFTYAVKRK